MANETEGNRSGERRERELLVRYPTHASSIGTSHEASQSNTTEGSSSGVQSSPPSETTSTVVQVGCRLNCCALLLLLLLREKEINSNECFYCLGYWQAEKEIELDFVLFAVSDTMFFPSESGMPGGMGGGAGRRPGSTRPGEAPTKLDYIKTFYYDPVKW